MRIVLVSALVSFSFGCDPAPEECFDKGDEKACNALCETGKEDLTTACYEMRARKVQACVDKDTDCPAACELWKNASEGDVAYTAYVAKLGTDDKVAKLKTKCEAAK